MSLCSTQEPKEIFERAKELINTPEKWMQYGSGITSFCVLGSLAEVLQSSTLSVSRLFARANGLEEYYIAIAEWNDTPGRTHAEVMAAFDKAIAYCDKEGQ